MKSKLDILFKEDTDNIFLQFFRYLFVGGFAFLVDFFLLYFFSEFCGIYYLISAILSFTISLIVNYILSTLWVFNKNQLNNKVAEFGVFALIGIIGLGFTEIFYIYSQTYSVYIICCLRLLQQQL